MLRAGMIRKLASGIYTWLPTGLRVLRKVENIVREEMNNVGAVEILMPVIQPSEVWQETGRWDKFGPKLLRMSDRHGRQFVLGPTHEEVITDLIRNEISSHKQLPINLYQIQTKFRDEIRPRFGIMRSREFIMKDAYSFHADHQSLLECYQAMSRAYRSIFERMDLDYRVVLADSGPMGGNQSQEFHLLAESGEDVIAFSNESSFAANVEKAESLAPKKAANAPTQEIFLGNTPNSNSMKNTVKTILVKPSEELDVPVVALLIRGDHELNHTKAESLPQVAKPLQLIAKEEVYALTGVFPSELGPVNLKFPLIADRSVATMNDFSAGANIHGKHYFGINWGRDIQLGIVKDIRNIVEGDPSPCGKGTVKLKRGIEVGHIFQLGTSYSRSMNAEIMGKDGKKKILEMGCYGMGCTRVVAAAIEQNNDQYGITWPDAIAPFQVTIVPINMYKSNRVHEVAESLYQGLIERGIEVLFDDRRESPGVMFSDMDLIGIPHMVVVSEKSIQLSHFEYKVRRTGKKYLVPEEDIYNFIQSQLLLTTKSR